MADGASARAQHEFSAEHNRSFGKLATGMTITAIAMAILGIIYIVAGAISFAMNPPVLLGIARGVVFVLIAVFLASGAKSIRHIITTEGNDITNLMAAMRKLRTVYSLQLWSFALLCLLAVLAVVLFFRGALG
jgi:hypothetical protein